MKRRPKRDDAARLKALRAEVRRLRGQVRRVEEDKRALQERNAFLNPRAGAGESEDILMPRHSLVLLDRLHAYRADRQVSPQFLRRNARDGLAAHSRESRYVGVTASRSPAEPSARSRSISHSITAVPRRRTRRAPRRSLPVPPSRAPASSRVFVVQEMEP